MTQEAHKGLVTLVMGRLEAWVVLNRYNDSAKKEAIAQK